MILAIDPGISMAWARTGKTICGWEILDCDAGEDFPFAHELVIECPEVYPDTRPSQANNLITLAVRVGRYQERLESQGTKVTLVKPKAWKGQTPKDVHHRRGRATLSAAEQALVDAAVLRAPKAKLDILDAVNLALWATGRLPR